MSRKAKKISESEYQGHAIEVFHRGYHRHILIDGEEFGIGPMEIPEVVAHKIIDNNELTKKDK